MVMALMTPVALSVSMYWTFRLLARQFGLPLGYLLGFVIYWLFWCLLVPTLILGSWQPIVEMFYPFPPFNTLSWQTQLALWWPLIFPLFFVFVPRISKATVPILIASIVLGVVIGITEEILWRGLYARLFPDNLWLSMIYPSIWFGLWHLAPQSILANRNSGGAVSFVVYAIILGITYSISVQLTQSIAWATVSHIIHDTLGLGGFAYAAWLKK
jgi:membrane protease YdiL (CAAX protease family)